MTLFSPPADPTPQDNSSEPAAKADGRGGAVASGEPVIDLVGDGPARVERGAPVTPLLGFPASIREDLPRPSPQLFLEREPLSEREAAELRALLLDADPSTESSIFARPLVGAVAPTSTETPVLRLDTPAEESANDAPPAVVLGAASRPEMVALVPGTMADVPVWRRRILVGLLGVLSLSAAIALFAIVSSSDDPASSTAVTAAAVPTTAISTTAAPTTAAPSTTAAPTTAAPTTAAPSTVASSTVVPSTAAPVTAAPATAAPVTTARPRTTARPVTTARPRTTARPATTISVSTTAPPTTSAATIPDVSFAPATVAAPTTAAPTTAAPTTAAPATAPSTPDAQTAESVASSE